VASGLDAVAVGDGDQFAGFVDGVELGAVLANGLASKGTVVDEEFDVVGVAVDLDRDGGAFVAGPGPAGDRVAPCPRASDERRAVVLRPVDRTYG
jgi:hypothetical protein